MSMLKRLNEFLSNCRSQTLVRGDPFTRNRSDRQRMPGVGPCRVDKGCHDAYKQYDSSKGRRSHIEVRIKPGRQRNNFVGVFQIDQQFRRRLITIAAILLQAPVNNLIQPAGAIYRNLSQRLRVTTHDRGNHFGVGFVCMRVFAGCHFIEHRAHAENIAAVIQLLSAQLLRGHVSDGADQ